MLTFFLIFAHHLLFFCIAQSICSNKYSEIKWYHLLLTPLPEVFCLVILGEIILYYFHQKKK